MNILTTDTDISFSLSAKLDSDFNKHIKRVLAGLFKHTLCNPKSIVHVLFAKCLISCVV